MWKKHLNFDRASKAKPAKLHIGQPTLLESTYDEYQLDRAHNLSPSDDIETPHSGGQAYSRPDIRPSRQDMDPPAPTPPLKLPSLGLKPSADADAKKAYRPSVAASSVYSELDPVAVSPPASPLRRPEYDDGRVSPIEEQYTHSPSSDYRSSVYRGSQIPVPRKPTPGGSKVMPLNVQKSKEWTQNVGKGAPMLWDDYSGEPTFDGAGKPSQVKPGEFNHRTALKPVSKNSMPTPAAGHESQKMGFKEKASRLAQRGLAIDTRPPWKGSSGRHAIVDAPADRPGQPLPQPRRTEDKRVRSPEMVQPDIVATSNTKDVASSPETQTVPASAYSQDFHQQKNVFSSLPRDNGTASFERQIDESAPAAAALLLSQDFHTLSSNTSSPVSDHSTTPTQYRTPTESAFPPAKSLVSLPSADSRASSAGNRSRHRVSDLHDPASRFSWTTTATSTYQHSPPSSPVPPLPVPSGYINNPKSSRQSAEDSPIVSAPNTSSVLDRGHPTRRLGDASAPPSATSSPAGARSFSAGSTLRKPVRSSLLAVQPPSPEPIRVRQQFPMADWRTGKPIDGQQQRSTSLSPTFSTTTTNSTAKNLPPTPQELSSSDLIASLTAQQDSLSLQKHNLQRLIAGLSTPEAKNPVTNSFKVIREREKTLAALRIELDDVVRGEHELGLRLHRAWKRRERDDPMGGGGGVFWVRRATSGAAGD